MAKRRIRLWVPITAAGLVLAGAVWLRLETRPTEPGPQFYVRYEHDVPLNSVLADLETRGAVRNRIAFRLYSVLLLRPQTVGRGTYAVRPGMSAGAILKELRSPIRRLVRIPETNWARRTANYLAERDVLNADEYMSLVKSPTLFKDDVPFPIQGDSLEGYLYPDTYDLPPLLGAKAVIVRQLKAFEKKVWAPLHPKDLYRTLIVASMVQMETGRRGDSPGIAGVIANRLKKNMPLQIDATILYALQKWRRLSYHDYRQVKSPYNTYLHTGLPPGPICSPTEKNVEAALNPQKHEFYYYVAMPDGKTLYSKTYAEHLQRIKLRRRALKALNAFSVGRSAS